MGDLSPHFSRKEFECRGCGRLVLDDNLLDGLEALRKLAGVPVVVNAGYRCRQHNQEVGGVPNSEHTRGWRPTFACPDCPCRGCTNWRWRSPNSPGEASGPMTATSSTSMFATTGRVGPALMASMSESSNCCASLSYWPRSRTKLTSDSERTRLAAFRRRGCGTGLVKRLYTT